jgi:hypothetical protein
LFQESDSTVVVFLPSRLYTGVLLLLLFLCVPAGNDICPRGFLHFNDVL